MATAKTSPNFAALQSILGHSATNNDTLTEMMADGVSSFANGAAEIAAKAFGGVGTVWNAGRAAGRLDGASYASRMLERSARKAGLTVEEAAQLLNAPQS